MKISCQVPSEDGVASYHNEEWDFFGGVKSFDSDWAITHIG